jgi:hypothetical protein
MDMNKEKTGKEAEAALPEQKVKRRSSARERVKGGLRAARLIAQSKNNEPLSGVVEEQSALIVSGDDKSVNPEVNPIENLEENSDEKAINSRSGPPETKPDSTSAPKVLSEAEAFNRLKEPLMNLIRETDSKKRGEALKDLLEGHLAETTDSLRGLLDNENYQQIVSGIQNAILTKLEPLAQKASIRKLEDFKQWCDGLIDSYKESFPEEGGAFPVVKRVLMGCVGVIVTLLTAVFRPFIDGVSEYANSFFAKPEAIELQNLRSGLDQMKANVETEVHASFAKP